MNYNNLVKELESLLSIELDSTLFPYQKGKSIRIGHLVVRESRHGFKIYDCVENKMIAQTFSKSSAVALARTLAKGKDYQKDILMIDKIINKNYNDCIFYKHTIANTSDRIKKDVVKTRYEDAKARTHVARQRLDKYIFD